MDDAKNKTSLKARIQKLGTALSGMVMPNIAAIIAWGLITAIFMAEGWFPNKQIAELIGPMLNYLLPLLIGYVGGRMVYEERGAVVGAIATIGVVVGSQVPMFLGAMIMGPLGGWCIKKLDSIFQDKVRSGLEMIYNNFTSGIMGMLLAIVGVYVVNPVVNTGSMLMGEGVDWIISVHLLPLANIFIEPAKVLFLNNAIGNGILVPLGIQQAASAGKSVLFLLESNPGPGLGVLLAFTFFGKGNAKGSAPGAAFIQFIGGIHEVYFPYILMKPAMFLAVIAGGVTGTFTFQMFGAGLKAAASPGSIIAILAMTPKGSYLGVLAGVVAGAVVSFIIAAIILKHDRSTADEFEAKQQEMAQMKAESKGKETPTNLAPADFSGIKKIIFACDAGMGSSAMGASLLRDKIKKAGITDVSVTNTAVSRLQDEPDLLVVTQAELAERAAQKTPSAVHVQVGNFLNSRRYDEIIARLKTETLINEETGAEPKATTGSELELSNVKEINFIRHDQNIGTSTMAVSLFKDSLHKAGKKVPVKAVRLDELVDSSDHLVIVTKEAKKNLDIRYTKVQVLVVSDLLTDEKLAQIIAGLA